MEGISLLAALAVLFYFFDPVIHLRITKLQLNFMPIFKNANFSNSQKIKSSRRRQKTHELSVDEDCSTLFACHKK